MTINLILSEPIVVPYLFNQEPFEETNFKNEGSYNMIVQLYNNHKYLVEWSNTKPQYFFMYYSGSL